MNKYITSSIFVAAGLSSVSASALNNLSDMRGSDTLLFVTRSAITDCGSNCAGLTYNGTGSGNGEGAMYSANEAQTIAPMSKFLTNKLCGTGTSVGASDSSGTLESYGIGVEQQACGMVIGLDGVSIWGSTNTAGSPACDNATAGGAGFGMAYDTTVTWTKSTSPTYGKGVHTYGSGTYTFSNWTDVLRVIYTGIDHDGCQDCESDVRNGVIQNWGNMFEGGAANCGNGTCTQLNHAFRRDDESGTTETFLLLIGAPAVTKTAGLGNSVGTDDPFCNSAQTRTGDKYLVNTQWTADPPALYTYPATCSEPPPDFKDRDPIRRACAGTNNDPGGVTNPTGAPPIEATEQVCSFNGQLGVVLPIIATDYWDLSKANPFPTNMCVQGRTVFGPRQPLNNDGLLRTGSCPNNDVALSTGSCLVPADANGNPNCMASKITKPGPATSNLTCKMDGVAPGGVDGRLYGLQGYYKTTSGTAGYMTDNTLPATGSAGRNITGMFTRIHTSRSMNTASPTTNTCTNPDATVQLGCLPTADNCSISYAGLGAGQGFAVNPMTLSTVFPTIANVQNNFRYPLGRKLYLNSMIGFANVWGAELQLAKYEATQASINTEIDKYGFIESPTGPYLEDFNEQMLCNNNNGTGTNVDGCANNPFGFAEGQTPPQITTCGNSTVEPYEDCDNGLANYATCPASDPAGSGNNVFTVCNQTCRTQFCFVKPTTCATCPCIAENNF